MSVLGWVLVVAIGWTVIATAVGVLVGRSIRLRDRQVPRGEPPVTGLPDPPTTPPTASAPPDDGPASPPPSSRSRRGTP